MAAAALEENQSLKAFSVTFEEERLGLSLSDGEDGGKGNACEMGQGVFFGNDLFFLNMTIFYYILQTFIRVFLLATS